MAEVKKNSGIIGLIAVIGIIAYVVLIALFEPSIATQAELNKDNPLLLLLFYFVTNPPFFLILVGSIAAGVHFKSFKYVLAGLLFDLALDFASTPHCVAITGVVRDYVCSDTAIILSMQSVLGFTISYWLYYLVLPVLFVLVAAELIGIKLFTRFLFKRK